MKQISFEHLNNKPEIEVRNNRESLIAQIVEATSEKNKPKLAKVLAIKSAQMKWSDTDLHALLGKKNDPSIRNYTAFVWWSLETQLSTPPTGQK